jgi:hypothetical protein
MGFWSWFWIWLGLSIGSLVVLGLIGKSLLNRSGEVVHQIERIMAPMQDLVEAMNSKPEKTERDSDLLTPVGDLEASRAKLLKQKSKKRDLRQRRLRSAVKHIDVNESRFTND